MYKRAKEYIPQFLNFLQEKEVIINYKLDKEVARCLYFDEFKPQHNIKGFSFAAMFSYLRFFKVIKYDKNTGTMTFNVDILNNITSNTKITKRKTFKIAPIIRAQQSHKIEAKLTVDDSAGASKAKKDQTSKSTECKACAVRFSTAKSFVQHQMTVKHLLRMDYIAHMKENTEVPGLVAEVVDGHGGGQEDIMVRLNEPKTIILNLLNKTSKDYEIRSLFEVNDRTPAIRVQNISLPCVLSVNTKLCLKIVILFSQNEFREYPIIFRLKDVETEKEVDVVKPLFFYAQSALVDDLQAVEPYKKVPRPTFSDAHDEIVGGEHTERNETDFNPKIRLQQYYIPDNITAVLNANFKEFRRMTASQRNILKDFQALLTDYDEKRTLNKSNYFKMCQLLLYLEEHQMWINIRKYDIDDQKLQAAKGYKSNFFELTVLGLAEHRPSLLRGDSVYVKDDKQNRVKYEGIVHKVNATSVVLGFSNRFAKDVHLHNKSYSVSFSFNRVTLRAEHQAIELIRKHNVIHLLCIQNIKAKQLQPRIFYWFNKNIQNNPMQQQAVQHILSETSRPAPYLIFGPPGTGKTVTIVEAILQIWRNKPLHRMLICTPSNSAADEITKRLIKFVPQRDLLRYIAPSYPFHLVDEEVKRYANNKNGEYYHPLLSNLITYRIVITTLVTASRLVNVGTPAGHFTNVFIDESGQATESETLIPVAGILTSLEKPGCINGQIVLAGDPKQLGPIIHSKKANEYGFGISMLERLMLHNPLYQKDENGQYNNAILTKLVKSYRSHPAILALPNKLFYDGELIPSGDQTLTHSAVGWAELPNRDFPVIFHSVSGKDQQEGNSPSFFNLQEIAVVVEYLEKLIGQHLCGLKITQEHIGIIAPYRKQVFKLQQVCAKKQWTDLSIGSVEQFQGQERRIIIISTVRTKPEFITHDEKFHLGFLQNPKRFNVAVTRAKALLIVIGNPSILQYDENWGAFIKYCRDNKAVHGKLTEVIDVAVLNSLVKSISLRNNASSITEDPNFSRGNI